MLRSKMASVLLGLGVSLSAMAQAPLAFPDITVYPDPAALEIDRFSRQIVDEIPHDAALPRLSKDLSSGSGDAQPCEDIRPS